MLEYCQATWNWWIHAVGGGAIVLALGWIALRTLKQPVHRGLVGGWIIRGALLVGVLCLLPAWWKIPAPSWLNPSRSPVETVDFSAQPMSMTETPSKPSASGLEAEADDPAFGRMIVEIPLDELVLNQIPHEERIVSDSPPALPIVLPSPTKEAKTLVAPAAVPTVPTARTEWSLQTGFQLGVFLVYALISSGLILQLLLGHFALRRLLRTARPLPEWARLVSDRLISQAGLPVLVQASDRVRSPICFGFFQPVVLIPKSLVQVGTVAELKWILAHEFDHVRRRDHRMVWWVGLARAVFFFIPWFWAVRRELALAQEYLADQAAVAADGRPVDYAAFLVQLTTDMAGTRCDRPPLAASGVQAGRSDLFRRVNMVLQNRSQFPRRFSRLGAAVTASSVLGLATVISGLGWANAQEPAPPREAPRIPAPAVPSVKELKDALNQALKKGDEPEIRRLFDALEKALTEKPKPVERPLEVPKDRLIERPTPAPQPPEPPMPPRRERPRDPQPPAEAPRQPNVPGEGRFVPRDQFVPAPNDLREQFDRQLRSFEDMIRRMENGESRQQLEKARDEFKKAMEEGLKQADAVREKLRDKGLVPRIIVGGADFFPPADFNFMPFPAEGFAFNRGAIAGFPMVQPRLGVGVEKPSPTLVEQLDLPKEGGLVIASVRNESPAAKAGLKTNDILVQFAGKDVPADPARFQEVVAGLNASEKYDAVVIRKGKKETVKGIELPEPGRRPGFDFPALGKMEISINGKDVSIKATEGEVKYTLVGELQNGRLKPNSISIQDGQETIEATSLEKLPRKYQPKVQQMFDSAQRLGGGGAPGFPGGGAGGGFGGGRGGAPGLPGGGAGGGRGGAPGQPGEGPARNPGGR